MGYKYNQKGKYWEAWYARRSSKTGKIINTRRKNLKTESAAKRVERQLISFVSQKLKESSTPNWKTAVRTYLKDCTLRGLTKKTIYNAKHCLEANTFKQWENRLINEISSHDILKLIKGDMEKCSESHKKTLLKFIRQVFEVSIAEGSITKNPSPKLFWKNKIKIKKVLTEKQVKFFLQKAKEMNWEWFPHCTVALYTGMRSGELFALKWNKVNLKSKQIIVDSSWNNKDGFKETKSGDDRILEIAPPLVLFLKELKKKTYETGFVLPRLWKWSKNEQARELRKFLIGINLSPIRFHDLRATWCTILLSKGVEPIKVMKMGGWKDLKTMQIYVRKAGIDIKGITDCLDFGE